MQVYLIRGKLQHSALHLNFLNCLSFSCALNASASEGSTEIRTTDPECWRQRHNSVSIMHSRELAGRLERRRSGAESVLCEWSIQDHDDYIAISAEKWVVKSHILLNIHCEK